MNLVICDTTDVIMSVACFIYRVPNMELVVKYDYEFMITLFTCLMSLSLFLSSTTVIISGGKYNL
jgi:hypothetical protein